jgi:hypothetical protein
MMMVRLSGETERRDCRGPHSCRIVAIKVQAGRGQKIFETMTQSWDSPVTATGPSGTATNEQLSKGTAAGTV